MNFLAHAFLSGSFGELMYGNFIADAVKGKNFKRLNEPVQHGVLLHRSIDQYTDQHFAVQDAVNQIKQEFGRYSGVVMDIYFDHFLAKRWADYCDMELGPFVRKVYFLLLTRYGVLPEKTRRMLPFMIIRNWLYNYSNLKELDLVFHGMSRRASFNSHMENGVKVLEEHYDDIEETFLQFFPQLIAYTQSQLLQEHEGKIDFWK